MQGFGPEAKAAFRRRFVDRSGRAEGADRIPHGSTQHDRTPMRSDDRDAVLAQYRCNNSTSLESAPVWRASSARSA